jgi:hypothetical protein
MPISFFIIEICRRSPCSPLLNRRNGVNNPKPLLIDHIRIAYALDGETDMFEYIEEDVEMV